MVSVRSRRWTTHPAYMGGESVTITHPCHPLAGTTLPVHHYRLHGSEPVVAVELPSGTGRLIPLAWTDRAQPEPHAAASAPGARLSGIALLEVARRIAWFKRRR